MSDPAPAHPIDPALRELGKVLHERYTLAARIARATWRKEETSPEAMVAATATLFIELNKQVSAAAMGATSPRRPGETPPVCGCGTIMASVVKTSPKMPDWRCPACDKAIWNRDRKKNGSHP